MQLGNEVEDKVTGMTGIATGRVEYLTGCNQYLVTPKVGENNNYVEPKWFDEGRLKVIGRGIAPESVKAADNGCDISAPVK